VGSSRTLTEESGAAELLGGVRFSSRIPTLPVRASLAFLSPQALRSLWTHCVRAWHARRRGWISAYWLSGIPCAGARSSRERKSPFADPGKRGRVYRAAFGNEAESGNPRRVRSDARAPPAVCSGCGQRACSRFAVPSTPCRSFAEFLAKPAQHGALLFLSGAADLRQQPNSGGFFASDILRTLIAGCTQRPEI